MLNILAQSLRVATGKSAPGAGAGHGAKPATGEKIRFQAPRDWGK